MKQEIVAFISAAIFAFLFAPAIINLLSFHNIKASDAPQVADAGNILRSTTHGEGPMGGNDGNKQDTKTNRDTAQKPSEHKRHDDRKGEVNHVEEKIDVVSKKESDERSAVGEKEVSKHTTAQKNEKKGRQMNPPNNETSLETFFINPEGLSITSFVYNPTKSYSSWIDRILGDKAVFFDKHVTDFQPNSDKPLSQDEIRKRTEIFRGHLKLPPYALWPACSFEVLGYVRLGIEEPFDYGLRKDPIVGKATMQIEGNQTWPCFYRSLYENWRQETEFSDPNFWSTVFYCPAEDDNECKYFESHIFNRQDTASFKIDFPHKSGKIWSADFTARLVSKKSRALDHVQAIGSMNYTLPMGICLAIPYTSSDPEKEIGNGAILFDWVRYHTALGIKVIIYDRDGSNRRHLFDSAYGRAMKYDTDKVSSLNVVYHPFTIRGLLDETRKGMRYDNTELKDEKKTADEDAFFRSRFESQGHDKTQTLTHCRFEAKALYGIDNVLVIDFDEFLYCPPGGTTAKSQGDYIRRLVHLHRVQGIEQLTIPQRFVGNMTSSPRNCVVSRAKQGKSIFDCFSSYKFYNGGHSVKSLHIGHKCPLTGYHQACTGPADAPRSYDCLCDSRLMRQNNWRPYAHREDRECAVMHLSTKVNNYIVPLYKFNEEERRAMALVKSELKEIVESVDVM
jgi:hypothetical protein